MGYIYKITNKIDNKIYIGQTIGDLERRWKGHLKKRSNCRYLKSAINKYGIDNFEFKLVCITFDNQLDDMEIKYIEQYNCLVPNGYNLRLGGNSGRHNVETKQKISETLKKRFNTDIIHSKPQLGKPHSEITKKKLSEANKGKRRSQETINKMIISKRKRKNKVIQFDIEGNRLNSFDTCKEAAEYIGISLSSISVCCIGKAKTAKGYVWKYESIK
jgi:group I intron endonuclease